MKCWLFLFVAIVLISGHLAYDNRQKRQLSGYSFPGPRIDAREDNVYTTESVTSRLKRKPQYEDLIDARQPVISARSQSSQAHRVSNPDLYSGVTYRGGGSQSYPASPNSYGPASPNVAVGYSGRPKVESYGGGNVRSNKPVEETVNKAEEEEEEKKPDRLAILLAESKFACSGKKDGYYADNSVNCQVFHYCVGGAKHSWMCPEGTVFHQVHLNCVPASQDICSQSEKFYVVNDYLHKPIDTQGPNNTIRYHQRYYPEEFLGDALAAAFPQSFPAGVSSGSRSNQAYGGDSYSADKPYGSSARDANPSSQYNPSSYDTYQPQSVPEQPYKPATKPYPNVSGSSSGARRQSYSQPNPSYDTSYNKPTPSSYSSSARSQPSANVYRPESTSTSYPSSQSYPYKPSNPSNLSPSSNYGPVSYSRGSSSSYSPQSNPKSSSYPPYPTYLASHPSSSYGSSSSNDQTSRAASFQGGRAYSSASKPFDFSGVTYEEDY